MQFNIFATVPISLVLLTILWVTIAILCIVLFYIIRWGGIGTGIAIVFKGGKMRIVKANESEKFVSAGKLTFSKISEGSHAAEPIMYMSRGRPRRLFKAYEGHPTVVDWFAGVKDDYPLPDFTAEDLSSITDAAIAKGLAKALIQQTKRDIVLTIVVLILGITMGLLMYPFIY